MNLQTLKKKQISKRFEHGTVAAETYSQRFIVTGWDLFW